jgi:hypothetical protein
MKPKNILPILLLVILSLASIPPTITVLGYTFDTILICDDLDIGTNEPNGIGYIYFSSSGNIFCWVNLTNVVKPLEIKFQWIQPDKERSRSSVIVTKSGSFPLLSAFDMIKVAGRSPASNPGLWSVEVYIDDVFEAKTEFYLLDYNEEISSLVVVIDDLTQSYDQMTSQYASLQGNFDELQDSYDNLTDSYALMRDHYDEMIIQNKKLQAQLDNLHSEYDELTVSYNDAMAEYDELVDDYDPLVRKLRDASYTMYAAIFGMMILLAVVVYLFKQSARIRSRI